MCWLLYVTLPKLQTFSRQFSHLGLAVSGSPGGATLIFTGKQEQKLFLASRSCNIYEFADTLPLAYWRVYYCNICDIKCFSVTFIFMVTVLRPSHSTTLHRHFKFYCVLVCQTELFFMRALREYKTEEVRDGRPASFHIDFTVLFSKMQQHKSIPGFL